MTPKDLQHIKDGICPRCGGQLVRVWGKFWWSEYKKCGDGECFFKFNMNSMKETSKDLYKDF